MRRVKLWFYMAPVSVHTVTGELSMAERRPHALPEISWQYKHEWDGRLCRATGGEIHPQETARPDGRQIVSWQTHLGTSTLSSFVLRHTTNCPVDRNTQRNKISPNSLRRYNSGHIASMLISVPSQVWMDSKLQRWHGASLTQLTQCTSYQKIFTGPTERAFYSNKSFSLKTYLF